MIPPRLQSLLRADGVPAQLARLFTEHGHRLYLVGGSVRDALLARSSGDLDFTTAARPEEIKRLVNLWADDVYTMGEAFGTIGAIRQGEVVEITTFRSEMYVNESRKPQVSFSDDIAEDLSRRDFTINAMALALPQAEGDQPEMVDPHGGLVDLASQVLRTPLDPHISFGDDPLRMLRLFRFVSVLGFEGDKAAIAAVEEMADRLAIVSAERIRDEFVKLMVGDHVGDALRGLLESGLAHRFLPELTELGMQQDPVHRHKDVLAHTVAVVEKTSPRERLRLAALFHDIGKPATREFGPDGVSFHHHEVVGARMTRARMRELRFPKDSVRDVSQLVFLHMRPHTLKMGWTDRAVRRYVRDADELLEDLNELVRCDVTTRNEKRAKSISRRIDELERRIAELAEQEELDSLRPPVDGNQVMEYLGIPPGPAVGEVMQMLMEHRLDHGPYSPEEAFALIDEWMAARS
ncbi:MAG: CCA tRNA nucleotidyltransferase [Acidimicrobiia bacterium]|nr:CCA tRNA nucleotidyltransferase [Acidimicrobiia bacterium]NNF63488.1 CCA tRNA nucleotidyltransferase [Acidimicrobiia bacterium]